MRLVCDVIEFCARHVPQWNPVSISGYRIPKPFDRRQELAFTLADGFHYVEQMLGPRPGRGRLRPAPVVLLQCAQ